MTASLGVRCHAGAETLTVASTTAGTGVRQAVHVEPGDIHLNIKKNQRIDIIIQFKTDLKALAPNIICVKGHDRSNDKITDGKLRQRK